MGGQISRLPGHFARLGCRGQSRPNLKNLDLRLVGLLALCALRGVGVPVASAILAVGDRIRYGGLISERGVKSSAKRSGPTGTQGDRGGPRRKMLVSGRGRGATEDVPRQTPGKGVV